MEMAVEKEAHGKKGKIKDSYKEMPLHHSPIYSSYAGFLFPYAVFLTLLKKKIERKSGMQFKDKQNTNK